MSTWLFRGYDEPVVSTSKEGIASPTGAVIKRVIPRRAQYRIEALPGRILVQEGTVSGQLAADLDPGKYIVSITKFTDTHEEDQAWTYEFLHEMTEDQWKHLQGMRPRIFRTINTSEGPRMRCQFLGCDYECSHKFAALLHEAEHWGVDLLAHKGEEMRELMASKSQSYLQDRRAAEIQRRMTADKE